MVGFGVTKITKKTQKVINNYTTVVYALTFQKLILRFVKWKT
jgi:hypothetical protein